MSSEYTLYQYGGDQTLPSISPPCLKVHLALRIMGLPHRLVNLESPAAVNRISPTKRVPCLRIDGRLIGESTAILDAVEAAHPDRALSPSAPAERARDRLWEHFVTDHAYWLGFYQRWIAPGSARRMLEALIPQRFRRKMISAVVVPSLRRRGRAHGVAGLPKDQALASFVRALETMNDGLEGGPFLGGRDQPGRGDVAAATLLVQAPFGGVMAKPAAEIRSRPALVAHVERTFARGELALPDWWAA